MQPTEETNGIPTDYEVAMENLPQAAILENKQGPVLVLSAWDDNAGPFGEVNFFSVLLLR